VIFFDRSPFATAVVTSAMLRTWLVLRFPAIELTLSVRSFTCRQRLARWLDHRGCLPTHLARDARDFRANRLSLSTIVLIVSLSSSISPRTVDRDLLGEVTVRDWPSSPAGDVAYLIREVAGIEFTLSVRSFHVPATPCTCACPPSLPSDRYFSRDARHFGCECVELVDHRVDGVFELDDFAFCFDGDLLGRSPSATAVVTSAMLRTWLVRLCAIQLTLSVRSFHVPATPGTMAWPPSLPLGSHFARDRVTSDAKPLSWSAMRLTTFALRRNAPLTGRPSTSSAMRCEKIAFGDGSDDRLTSTSGSAKPEMIPFSDLT